VARTGDKRNAYRVLVEKFEAKTRHNWEANTKKIINKWDWITWAGFVWLRIDRCVVNTAMNIRVP